jgi:FMN phosphatase YigB (HAD superfamily)
MGPTGRRRCAAAGKSPLAHLQRLLPPATPEIQINERLRRRLEGSPMAPREYLTIDLANLPPKTDELDLLDDAGKDGWKLTSITNNQCQRLL